jgi:hypothetical protein
MEKIAAVLILDLSGGCGNKLMETADRAEKLKVSKPLDLVFKIARSPD